jgi:uncharacterized protein involved in exopolysaccharide biosynthesis
MQWVSETMLRWRLVLWTIGFALLAALLAVLLLPPVYRSSVSFVANASGGSKLPNSIASSGALAGLAAQFGVNPSNDPSESPNFYIQLIYSRELLTRLLESRFPDPRGKTVRDSATFLDILRIRKSDPKRRLEVAIKNLRKGIGAGFDVKTNFVWLDVDTQWPELSAAVANRTVDLVTEFNREQRVSRARSKRVFLQERVNLAKNELDATEARHRIFSEQNRSWHSSPALVEEEARLQRDVDRRSNLYLQLQQQLETTMMDEVNGADLITIVDSAVPARKAEWPQYGVLLLSTLGFGTLLGLMIAGAAAVLSDWRERNPTSAMRLSGTMRSVRHEMTHVFRRPRGDAQRSQRRAG